jgi:hypothetical protein
MRYVTVVQLDNAQARKEGGRDIAEELGKGVPTTSSLINHNPSSIDYHPTSMVKRLR